MKIRFLSACSVETHTNVCCFSGRCTKGRVEFAAGDVIETPCQLCNVDNATSHLVINNERATRLHPDMYLNVPNSAFEVIAEPAPAAS